MKRTTLTGRAVTEAPSYPPRGNRYRQGSTVPPFSADGCQTVYDNHSDNADTLVHVDPDNILTPANARALAALIARAMSEGGFTPTYPRD